MSEWLNGFLPSKLFPIHCCFCMIWFSLWFNKLSLWHFKNSSLQSVNGIVLIPLRIVALTSLNGDEYRIQWREKSRNESEWKVENGRHVPNVWCNFFPRSVMNSTWFVLFYYDVIILTISNQHALTFIQTWLLWHYGKLITRNLLLSNPCYLLLSPSSDQKKSMPFSYQLSDKTFKRSFKILRLCIVWD